MLKNLRRQLIWLANLVAGFVLIDIGEFTGIVHSYFENALDSIGIHIILAVGLNHFIGFSGLFTLGLAGFMDIGAYATEFDSTNMATPLGFYLAMSLGMVIAVIAALIVGIPTLRLRGEVLEFDTMGAAEIIRVIIHNLKNSHGPAGMLHIPPLASWPTVYVLMCVTTVDFVHFVHSRTGRANLAIRDDDIAAESIGIHPTQWKLAAFVLGADTAAIGGSLHECYLQTIAPGDFGIMN